MVVHTQSDILSQSSTDSCWSFDSSGGSGQYHIFLFLRFIWGGSLAITALAGCVHICGLTALAFPSGSNLGGRRFMIPGLSLRLRISIVGPDVSLFGVPVFGDNSVASSTAVRHTLVMVFCEA
jgi:hypothetical protein